MTVLHWQMNAAGYEKLSVGTAMRSYFLEHEVGRGAKKLIYYGGTPHSMGHSFERKKWLISWSGESRCNRQPCSARCDCWPRCARTLASTACSSKWSGNRHLDWRSVERERVVVKRRKRGRDRARKAVVVWQAVK